MNIFKQIIPAVAILVSSCFFACTDPNEFSDWDNPNWSSPEKEYTDSAKYTHPESLDGTYWTRAEGFKFNAYGEEIQGYVESVDFIDHNYVVVKMSEGKIPESIKATAIWLDESNTDALPQYEYKYAPTTGSIEILKEIVDDKGKVSKVAIFTAVVVSGKQDVITISHYGDTPSQTYLVKGNKPVSE